MIWLLSRKELWLYRIAATLTISGFGLLGYGIYWCFSHWNEIHQIMDKAIKFFNCVS